MPLTMNEIERAIGFFGPGSITWRIARETAMFLGGPRALMLQIAHPAVAAAVERHSDFRTDPLGRGQRTFETVHAIIFGDRTRALDAIQRLARRHAPVRGHVDEVSASPWSGRDYHAESPELLLWVHATLIDTAMHVYQSVVRPLERDEAERYWQESRVLGELVGIPRETLPSSLADFRAYFDRMVDSAELQVGAIARQQWDALARVRPSAGLASIYGESWAQKWKLLVDRAPLKQTSSQLTHLLGAGMLPPRLRRAFGYGWGRREQLSYDAVLSLARVVCHRLPRRVRYIPGFHAAMARVKLQESPGFRIRPIHSPRV
jgi:uncharacterized protein (DUF2236 family)